MPYILIIAINKENNNHIFSFPEILDLNKYITNISPNNNKVNLKDKFELIGIISHNSDNPKKYYAFCKNRILNDWYKYDDLIISNCQNKINDILKENIDVLIYKSALIQNNYKRNYSTSFQTNNDINSNSFIINNINNNNNYMLNTTLKVLTENNLFNNINNNNIQNNFIYNQEKSNQVNSFNVSKEQFELFNNSTTKKIFNNNEKNK